jgi:hypothetical protein
MIAPFAELHAGWPAPPHTSHVWTALQLVPLAQAAAQLSVPPQPLATVPHSTRVWPFTSTVQPSAAVRAMQTHWLFVQLCPLALEAQFASVVHSTH